jgi:hypothetical protein
MGHIIGMSLIKVKLFIFLFRLMGLIINKQIKKYGFWALGLFTRNKTKRFLFICFIIINMARITH